MIESLLAQDVARKVVEKKYYPPPSVYASMQYLHLLVNLNDGSPVMVRIDRYLNGGIKNNPQYPRALNADREKDGLLSAIANELKAKFLPHLNSRLRDGRSSCSTYSVSSLAKARPSRSARSSGSPRVTTARTAEP
jgi:hypothetical protein